MFILVFCKIEFKIRNFKFSKIFRNSTKINNLPANVPLYTSPLSLSSLSRSKLFQFQIEKRFTYLLLIMGRASFVRYIFWQRSALVGTPAMKRNEHKKSFRKWITFDSSTGISSYKQRRRCGSLFFSRR